MVVLRAPEDALPELASAPGQLTVRGVGSPAADQGIFARGARCGIGPAGACEVVATLRNGDARRHVDRYAAFVDGRRSATLRVEVPARSTAQIAFTAPAGTSVRLQLTKRDALALDDTAWFTVPSAADTPASMTVTLVGDPATAKPLAQALAAAPGVNLELRTRATYRRSDALGSNLVVLDGFVPAGGLPPAPAVVLIDPPRLPGGLVGGKLSAATVSSAATGNDLIAGVDLGSLSIDRNAARQLELPSWLEPLVWSPSGTLLAAGDNGRQRVAVLAFDPVRGRTSRSFPPSRSWRATSCAGRAAGRRSTTEARSRSTPSPARRAPRVAAAGGGPHGRPLAGRPRASPDSRRARYRVSASGAGVTHRRTLAASLALPTTIADATTLGPIDLASWAAAAPCAAQGATLSAWLIVLALIAIGGEWVYWRWLGGA